MMKAPICSDAVGALMSVLRSINIGVVIDTSFVTFFISTIVILALFRSLSIAIQSPINNKEEVIMKSFNIHVLLASIIESMWGVGISITATMCLST